MRMSPELWRSICAFGGSFGSRPHFPAWCGPVVREYDGYLQVAGIAGLTQPPDFLKQVK